MKKTLAWYKRFVHEEWTIELKLRQENDKLILHRREKHYEDNKHTIIDFGEINPENMSKALHGLRNNISPA